MFSLLFVTTAFATIYILLAVNLSWPRPPQPALALVAVLAFPWLFATSIVDALYAHFEVPQEVTFLEQLEEAWEAYLTLFEERF